MAVTIPDNRAKITEAEHLLAQLKAGEAARQRELEAAKVARRRAWAQAVIEAAPAWRPARERAMQAAKREFVAACREPDLSAAHAKYAAWAVATATYNVAVNDIAAACAVLGVEADPVTGVAIERSQAQLPTDFFELFRRGLTSAAHDPAHDLTHTHNERRQRLIETGEGELAALVPAIEAGKDDAR
jgi:hypothetical protein